VEPSPHQIYATNTLAQSRNQQESVMLSPWYYTDDELIAYCDDHNDPVVREAIKLAYDAKKEFQDEIWELKSSLQFAEDARDEAFYDAKYSESKYKALMLDNDSERYNKEMLRLKAELLDCIEANRGLSNQVDRYQHQIKKLESKLDTWTAIAT
jgi:hypothetical protein